MEISGGEYVFTVDEVGYSRNSIASNLGVPS
jgi:hypothetical protein